MYSQTCDLSPHIIPSPHKGTSDLLTVTPHPVPPSPAQAITTCLLSLDLPAVDILYPGNNTTCGLL